jgi:hypothetical protein
MDDVGRAFLALRDILGGMEVQTKPSAGNYEYFTAYTKLDPKTGNPSNGVFVYSRDGRTMFRWGAFNQHSMEDIPGAARRIREYIEAQTILNRIDDPSAEAF